MTIITANRAALARAADFAARVLPSRPTVPALAGILIEPGDGTLTVAGGDYDTTATATVDAEVSAAAEPLLLPGALFASWLNTARGASVTLDVDAAARKVTCRAGARITLPMMLAADAPERPKVPDAALTLPRTILTEALRRVAGAVGTDPLIPAVMMTHIAVDHDTLTVSATNRYIIARVTTPLPVGLTGVVRFEAEPGHRLLSDLLGRLDGQDVSLAVAGGVLHVAGATTSASVRLLADGERFNWEALDRVLSRPPEHPGVAIVESAALAQEVTALGKLAATAGAKHKHVVITAADGEAVISLYNTERADAESAPIPWGSDPVKFPIDADYLLAGLTCVNSAEVHLTGAVPGKPVRFSSPESTGVAVVMPLRADK